MLYHAKIFKTRHYEQNNITSLYSERA